MEQDLSGDKGRKKQRDALGREVGTFILYIYIYKSICICIERVCIELCEQRFLKDSELITSYSQVWAQVWGEKRGSCSIISITLECFTTILCTTLVIKDTNSSINDSREGCLSSGEHQSFINFGFGPDRSRQQMFVYSLKTHCLGPGGRKQFAKPLSRNRRMLSMSWKIVLNNA